MVARKFGMRKLVSVMFFPETPDKLLFDPMKNLLLVPSQEFWITC